MPIDSNYPRSTELPIKTGREQYAVGGLVFGLGSILLLYPWPLAILCSAIGLGLSVRGIKSRRRKMAITGLVCSGLVLTLVAVLAVATLLSGGSCWCYRSPRRFVNISVLAQVMPEFSSRTGCFKRGASRRDPEQD
ncbi:MAG TPA: hypothetical protein VG944_23780 [Fimbriimonas sp.]|nr:hypothetical protein [Fimbriimonas sp.]